MKHNHYEEIDLDDEDEEIELTEDLLKRWKEQGIEVILN